MAALVRTAPGHLGLGLVGQSDTLHPFFSNLMSLDNYNIDLLRPFSLLPFSLFSLRVPGVSASKRAGTHHAPLLNADPLSLLILSL